MVSTIEAVQMLEQWCSERGLAVYLTFTPANQGGPVWLVDDTDGHNGRDESLAVAVTRFLEVPR